MEYTWKISGMRASDAAELKKAIISVSWCKIGTDENGLTGEFYGVNEFKVTEISPDGFVPYEELTEEIVIGWVKDKIFDTEYVNRMIAQQIEKKKSAEYVVDLPWSPVIPPFTDTTPAALNSQTENP